MAAEQAREPIDDRRDATDQLVMALANEPSREGLSESALSHLLSILRVDAAALYLFDADQQRLVLLKQRDFPRELNRPFAQFPLDGATARLPLDDEQRIDRARAEHEAPVVRADLDRDIVDVDHHVLGRALRADLDLDAQDLASGLDPAIRRAEPQLARDHLGEDVRVHVFSLRPRPLRNDDELALHQADDVLRCVEVGAGKVIEDLLELAVIEDELERVELARRQVTELPGEWGRHGER